MFIANNGLKKAKRFCKDTKANGLVNVTNVLMNEGKLNVKKQKKPDPFYKYIQNITKTLGSKPNIKAINDCLILLKAMHDEEPDPVTVDFIERLTRFKNFVSNLQGLEEMVASGKYANQTKIKAIYQKVETYQKNVITKYNKR